MITVRFNYSKEHILQVPWLLEKAFGNLPNVELITEGIADIAVNSMPWNGIVSGKKTVYWELDIAEYNRMGEYDKFDIVYFPSNMRQEMWPEHGKFLPMAVDTAYFKPIDIKPTKDLVFMGRLDRSLRSEYLDNLGNKFQIKVGTNERGLPTSQSLCDGRCSLQISEFQNLEQRNFEYSAVVPMILERVPDIDLFTEDKHYKGFDRDNYQELEDQVSWCVDNYEEALKMRDRMIKHLKNKHTYEHRAKQIIKDCGF